MGYIYGIRCGKYLKIGCTADPRLRLAQIRRRMAGTVYPDDADLSAAVPVFAVHGDRHGEHVLQSAFAPERAAGEWFHYRDGVQRWCEKLSAKTDSQREGSLLTPFRPTSRGVIEF